MGFRTSSARLLADDAVITQEGTRWKLETAIMERVIALEDGKLLLKSLKNKISGRELVPMGGKNSITERSG